MSHFRTFSVMHYSLLMKRSIWDKEYNALRKALKKLRKDQGLSQLELANILDKPRTYVTKYETADRNLDFVEVIKVCKALNSDPISFIKVYLKKIDS